jgi:hypothetical protein
MKHSTQIVEIEHERNAIEQSGWMNYYADRDGSESSYQTSRYCVEATDKAAASLSMFVIVHNLNTIQASFVCHIALRACA